MTIVTVSTQDNAFFQDIQREWHFILPSRAHSLHARKKKTAVEKLSKVLQWCYFSYNTQLRTLIEIIENLLTVTYVHAPIHSHSHLCDVISADVSITLVPLSTSVYHAQVHGHKVIINEYKR